MNPSKLLIRTALSLSISFLRVTTMTAEQPSMLNPAAIPQGNSIESITPQHRAVYIRTNDEEMNKLLSEGDNLLYATNAIGDSGMASGQSDPVLMKLINERMAEVGHNSSDLEKGLTAQK